MYSVTINTSFLLNENVILLLIKQKLSQSESCINKRNFIQVLGAGSLEEKEISQTEAII